MALQPQLDRSAATGLAWVAVENQSGFGAACPRAAIRFNQIAQYAVHDVCKTTRMSIAVELAQAGPSQAPAASPDRTLARVRARLGAPAYEQPGVLLYRGDCIELMAALGEEMIDLTVTSPPYNIGKEYETQRNLDEYLKWSSEWICRLYSVTQPNGAFWLNLGYLSVPGRAKAVPIPYLLWDSVPFYLIQEIVWAYGAGVAARRSFSPRNEKFLWYVRDEEDYVFDLDAVRDPNVKYPKQKKNGKLKCNPLGKNPTDVWQFPKVTSGTNRSSKERTPHPAQFPLAVIERIVRACSGPTGLILDPFMGSGTVAEAALRQGRPVVGFEIEPRYIDIAAARLSDAATALRHADAQLTLVSGKDWH
jgi:adenine-specific DNA-methyltransferase